MTDDELAEARRLADAATPPPWVPADDSPYRHEDTTFIIAARTLVPALLDEVAHLRIHYDELSRRMTPEADYATVVGALDRAMEIQADDRARIATLTADASRLRAQVVEGHEHLDGCMVERRVAIEMAKAAIKRERVEIERAFRAGAAAGAKLHEDPDPYSSDPIRLALNAYNAAAKEGA